MQWFRGATPLEVIALRVDAGEEVRPALARLARDLPLAAGSVLSGHGTLEHFVLEVPATVTWPPGIHSVEKQGATQIISAQGLIANGEVDVTLCVARRNEIYAGRVLDGTKALFGAEFVILRAGNTRWTYASHPQTGVPVFEAVTSGPLAQVTLMGRPIDPAAAALVPPALIRKHLALPVARTGDTLVLAMADPNNPFAIDDFRHATRLRIQPVSVDPRELMAAIEQVLAGRG
ncbi:MAG: DUF296 domain-containing protein [Armatimonadetes bacterium]|nr:DUF296 domain-containing protein [Armatimonadota bacterium]